MFAKRRTARTTCRINSPANSITKIIGTSMTAMAFGNCMWGTRFLKKPPTPNFCTPVPSTAQNAIPASAAVTVRAPVAEPAQGTIPSKLQNKMKKNRFHKKGRNLSASCLPIDGRATSSRMKSSITSKKFQNRPLGGPPTRIRLAKLRNTSSMSAATISSKTMNFVTWKPSTFGITQLLPKGK